MSYKFLEHATDAFIEVTAKDLKEAFVVTANAVINITLDQDRVEEKVASGGLSSQEGAEIISNIVLIKQDVHQNKGKNELRDEIAALKIKMVNKVQ